MRRFILWITVAVSLLALAGIGSYFVLRPSWMAAELERAIAARSGLEARFGTGPALVLWPETAVVFRDVELGPKGKPLLAIGVLTLKTSAAALLSRTLDIKEVALENPRVDLRIAGDGAANFDLGEALGAPLLFSVKNGVLAYEDARSGESFAASEIAVNGLFGNEGMSVEARGLAVWNAQAVELSLALKSLTRLARDGSPVSFGINAPSGSFGLVGRAATRRGFNLAGETSVEAADLRAFLKWLGTPIGGTRGLKNVAIDGGLDASRGLIKIKQAKVKFDGFEGLGDLAVTPAKNGPVLEGRLFMDALATAPYVDLSPGDEWSRAPVDLNWLLGFNARLDVSVKKANLGPWEAGPVDFALMVDNGRLGLESKSFALGGGKASLAGALSPGEGKPALGFRGTLEAVDAALLSPHIKGPLSLVFDLSSSGASTEELVAGLAGEATLSLPQAALAGFDIPGLLKSAPVAAIAPAPEDSGVLAEGAASFRLRDGIAALSGGTAKIGETAVTAEGEIDLLRRALDLTISAPVGVNGEAAWFALSGPWGKPGIAPVPPPAAPQ